LRVVNPRGGYLAGSKGGVASSIKNKLRLFASSVNRFVTPRADPLYQATAFSTQKPYTQGISSDFLNTEKEIGAIGLGDSGLARSAVKVFDLWGFRH